MGGLGINIARKARENFQPSTPPEMKFENSCMLTKVELLSTVKKVCKEGRQMCITISYQAYSSKEFYQRAIMGPKYWGRGGVQL